jgi:hypothetical protein
MNDKRTVYFIFVLLMIGLSRGLTANVTEFDDGGSDFNITSNYTGYITLPLNISVEVAELDITGLNSSDYQPIIENGTSYYINGFGDFPASKPYYANDSDYDTFALRTGDAVFEVNYTNNINYIDMNWKIKDNLYGDNTRNLTVPIDCIKYNDTTVNFRILAYTNLNVYLYCQNSTGWELLETNTLGTSYKLYEESIFSAIGKPPSNINITVNGTNIFSQSGNLTGTNSSIDFTSELESCNNFQAVCPVVVTADSFGKLNINNLLVTYNKTNFAILTIDDPSEITGSIESGDSIIQNVNITNSGNYNATNISFLTVSVAGTPNYNSSISFECDNETIVNSSTVSCDVTFSNLILNPEPDEKLKICSIGTDTGDQICSNGIDVDVVVTQPESSGGGGGGSSASDWKVLDPPNRVFNLLGWKGYTTGNKRFRVYNNESSTIYLNVNTIGLDCELGSKTMEIQGGSTGINTILCQFPEEYDEGKIVINGGGRTQSIDVVLQSKLIGLYWVYLQGNAYENVYLAIISALITWAFTLVLLIGGVLLLQVIFRGG